MKRTQDLVIQLGQTSEGPSDASTITHVRASRKRCMMSTASARTFLAAVNYCSALAVYDEVTEENLSKHLPLGEVIVYNGEYNCGEM